MTLSNKIYMFEYTPHMSHNLDIFLARYYHCISNVNIKAIFFHLLLQFYIAAMHFSKRKFVFRPDKKPMDSFIIFSTLKNQKPLILDKDLPHVTLFPRIVEHYYCVAISNKASLSQPYENIMTATAGGVQSVGWKWQSVTALVTIFFLALVIQLVRLAVVVVDRPVISCHMNLINEGISFN